MSPGCWCVSQQRGCSRQDWQKSLSATEDIEWNRTWRPKRHGNTSKQEQPLLMHKSIFFQKWVICLKNKEVGPTTKRCLCWKLNTIKIHSAWHKMFRLVAAAAVWDHIQTRRANPERSFPRVLENISLLGLYLPVSFCISTSHCSYYHRLQGGTNLRSGQFLIRCIKYTLE